MKTYAAFYDDNIRMKSSSGGVFSLVASYFDVVYGVSMTADCYGAEFVRVEKDISQLRGSKYIQAKVGDTFKLVKQDLNDGKNILFTGTGCQINGLSTYLGKEYKNLFLMDIICHGVPSPKLWMEYVKYQEKQYGKLEKVDFRCKDAGWHNFGMKENELYIPKGQDTYMRMFLRNYCLRPSCYKCHAKYYKKADLTIGDFWGVEEVVPEINDGNGTSLIIVRTEKGQHLFDLIKESLIWKEVSYSESIKFNTAEYSSVSKPAERNVFFEDLNSVLFCDMEKKYAADNETSIIDKSKKIVKRILKFINGGGTIAKSNNNYGVLYKFINNKN